QDQAEYAGPNLVQSLRLSINHLLQSVRAFNKFPNEKKVNNRRHSDGFFIAATPSLQSRACCGRYIFLKLNHQG
ncbi:hypothetical protein, partial [Lacimicrobium alkaliphilum]